MSRELLNKTVRYGNETYKVVGVGVKHDSGAVILHLSSTTRFNQQKNGAVPAQIVDLICVGELEVVS